ncbi:threonine ammonia-lyase [Clostridium baratii]|uniref:L-threonine dehydratase catabolic TdcB n=1 Tax=Clostridium baratii TaxID=1561 RepID=A0A174TBQ6_9CLOT|nr:threonine ammonia-lyase [Clostridium baratii]OPF52680.1 threonine ammonia-lyase [Clostridium baratii]OPF56129.1 threonine ammonia-lyase [Clostridium baratii]OPF58276.1 threonine ammonia-lyase [Clostridium baratii]OPF59489.1 threonine ammonia-lyase [Clostridium baratii]CUQ05378.1 threonine dehydratase [Clostridium baratii]
MNLDNIRVAKENIKDVVVKTPLLHSNFFSKQSNNNVYMKCENLQLTGAYKLRGALNKMMSLSDEEKKKGVVCSSAGNHAQGVAYAANLMGIKATIVMPTTTPYLKVKSTKDLGGNVILHGSVYDDAYSYAKKLEEEKGYTFLHPFNDVNVIYGQGTIALEILEDLKNVDVIVCPIGGGGLISGVALAAKGINSNIKIIGVQAAGANAMETSFHLGKLTPLTSVNTIADGIAVKSPGDITFSIIKEYVDEIITVTDDEIVDAFLALSEKHKLIAEASGAASLAALSKLNFEGKNIVSIISGGNIDMLTITSLINSGLVSRGRLFCFSIELPNIPGELNRITHILKELNANVVKLEHNQFKAVNKLKNTLLEVTVETNGYEHIDTIKNRFISDGYLIEQLY